MRILLMLALLGGAFSFVPESSAGLCDLLLGGNSFFSYSLKPRRFRVHTLSFHNGKTTARTETHNVEVLRTSVPFDGEIGDEFVDKWESTITEDDGRVVNLSGEHVWMQHYEKGNLYVLPKTNGKYVGSWYLGGSEPSVGNQFYDVVNTTWEWSKIKNFALPQQPGRPTEYVTGYKLEAVRANGPFKGNYRIFVPGRRLIYMESKWGDEVGSQTWYEEF